MESQEALGDSFGTTSAPRGPQDRKRHAKLGSLAAPRDSQRSLKIILFILKPEPKGKKEASRMHLAKSLILKGFCLHFGAFCEALGIIKIMKSVQSSANSGFWLVEDGDAFWASFWWPVHPTCN